MPNFNFAKLLSLFKFELGLSASMEYALWYGEWTSQYLAGQDQKDHDVHAARLQTAQRPVRQLRGVLQAAERLSIPQV
jgi:hypothetical protein